MKAAIVTAAGQPPIYGDFPNPTPTGDAHLVTVTASALNHVTRSRASGTHYTSATGGGRPFVPGVDGTGVLEDGRRVYFVMPEAPYGGLGEQTLVPPSRCSPGATPSGPPRWPTRACLPGRPSRSVPGWSGAKRF